MHSNDIHIKFPFFRKSTPRERAAASVKESQPSSPTSGGEMSLYKSDVPRFSYEAFFEAIDRKETFIHIRRLHNFWVLWTPLPKSAFGMWIDLQLPFKGHVQMTSAKFWGFLTRLVGI